MLLGKKMGWNELDDLKACLKFIQVSRMAYCFQLYHITRTAGFNFLFDFFYMLFSYLFSWLLCNWFCTWVWQVTFSPWQPAQDWTVQMFWCWGGACAQFSSQHFSCSNFSSTDAKAHYWTVPMVINSNFSATPLWPPINPWCFVIQSWDMFQHDRIWHFQTISVPPPQLSVSSMSGRWKKK